MRIYDANISALREDTRCLERKIMVLLRRQSAALREMRRTVATKDDVSRIVERLRGLADTYAACWRQLEKRA